MRFLSVIRTAETDQQPSERLMEDMGKLMEEMIAEGKLIRTGGLLPSSEGFRVRLRGGELTAVDGPFAEAKEVIGGYAVLEADSKDEAKRLIERFLLVHGDEWDIECEVRPLEGPEFGPGA